MDYKIEVKKLRKVLNMLIADMDKHAKNHESPLGIGAGVGFVKDYQISIYVDKKEGNETDNDLIEKAIYELGNEG